MVLIFMALKYYIYKCAHGYFTNLYEMILHYKSKKKNLKIENKINLGDALITFYIMCMLYMYEQF